MSDQATELSCMKCAESAFLGGLGPGESRTEEGHRKQRGSGLLGELFD